MQSLELTEAYIEHCSRLVIANFLADAAVSRLVKIGYPLVAKAFVGRDVDTPYLYAGIHDYAKKYNYSTHDTLMVQRFAEPIERIAGVAVSKSPGVSSTNLLHGVRHGLGDVRDALSSELLYGMLGLQAARDAADVHSKDPQPRKKAICKDGRFLGYKPIEVTAEIRRFPPPHGLPEVSFMEQRWITPDGEPYHAPYVSVIRTAYAL